MLPQERANGLAAPAELFEPPFYLLDAVAPRRAKRKVQLQTAEHDPRWLGLPRVSLLLVQINAFDLQQHVRSATDGN